jgi:CheY-like chemotaxis protein
MASILVADDEADIRDLIDAVLSAAGHAVATVPDGAEALDRFADEEFDLVCLDYRMPVLDGIATTEAIRGRHGHAVPILLLTASASPTDLTRAQRAGISAYLAKPFPPARLREQVSQMLGD